LRNLAYDTLTMFPKERRRKMNNETKRKADLTGSERLLIPLFNRVLFKHTRHRPSESFDIVEHLNNGWFIVQGDGYNYTKFAAHYNGHAPFQVSLPWYVTKNGIPINYNDISINNLPQHMQFRVKQNPNVSRSKISNSKKRAKNQNNKNQNNTKPTKAARG